MDEADRALRYLQDGYSVDLVGRAGSGRSRIVARVRVALSEAGRHVIQVHGVPAQRERAVGVLLTGTRDARAGRPALVRDPVAVLEREIRAGTVVLVDDADDLDPVAAGILGAAHVAWQVPVLLTRRIAPPRSAAVRALVTGLRPAVRVQVAPVRFGDVHRLVHELLGADVDPLAVARIATKSGGLPGLVRSLVLVGRETGALQRVGGTWTAMRGLWSPELAHAAEGLLADVDPEDVDVLATLADVGAVELRAAIRMVDPGRFAALRRAGLVEVIGGADGGFVSLFPPLVAEYLVHEHPAPHRPGHGAAVLPGPRDVLGGEATWPDDPVLSRVIAQHWAHEVGERRARWEADPALTTAVPLLRALLSTGNPVDEVRDVYVATEPRKGSAADRAELAGWYAVSLASAHGSPERAVRLLGEVRAAHPDTAGYVDAVEDHLRVFYDRVPSLDRGGADDPAGALDAPAREARSGVLIEAALAGGRVRDAERRLAGLAPAHPTFRRHRHVSTGLAAVLAGRLDEGIAWALDHLATARLERDSGSVVAHSYAAALGMAAAGRLGELDAVLSSVLTMTTVPALHEHYRTGALGLAAVSARWEGRRVPRLVERPGQGVRRPGPYPAMLTRDTFVTGGRPAVLRAAVLDRLERGYVASGIVAAVEVVERFDTSVADLALREHARDAESPLLDALVRYAEALSEQDTDGLAESVRAFEPLGAHLYVARARIALSLALRAGGQPVAALAQIEAAWSLAQQFGAPVTGLFAPVVAAVDLSGRELHVVELHAVGLSTGEIATALTLSPRTVESHFSSAYRKLGLDSRDGLRLATSTWLAPALRQATTV